MKNTIYKLIGIVLLTIQLAHAQTPKVFLTAPNIENESLVNGYTDKHIEIWNVSYSTTNDKFITTKPNLNNSTAKATTGVLSFTKYKSKNSHIFNILIVTGDKFATMDILFTKYLTGGYQTYMLYTITTAYVVSIKDNNDFTETIELVPKTMNMVYKPTTAQGGLGTPINYGWNFGTNAVLP